jgi:hypothetical protein
MPSSVIDDELVAAALAHCSVLKILFFKVAERDES